jgi:antitoxin component HigA of HigAB toxin-antitoxin module
MTVCERQVRARADEVRALSRLRRQEGVVLGDLALSSGYSKSWLCEALKGRKALTRDQVRRLRQAIREIIARRTGAVA